VSAVAELPDPDTLEVEAVLLASEERPISKQAIRTAVRIAKRSGAPVHVLAIARIWGTSLGFPNPGLYPSRSEWDKQRAIVDTAVRALERAGVEADGHVIGARNATKRIVREAIRLHCGAIVMGADEPRGRFVGNFIWSQEPQRVRRRAGVPVYLVTGS
jgi:nucleotide-binding universal stress UspA family protein